MADVREVEKRDWRVVVGWFWVGVILDRVTGFVDWPCWELANETSGIRVVDHGSCSDCVRDETNEVFDVAGFSHRSTWVEDRV